MMKKIIMIILIAVFSQVAMAAIETDSRTFGENGIEQNAPVIRWNLERWGNAPSECDTWRYNEWRRGLYQGDMEIRRF